jgi:hypothetical protein
MDGNLLPKNSAQQPFSAQGALQNVQTLRTPQLLLLTVTRLSQKKKLYQAIKGLKLLAIIKN